MFSGLAISLSFCLSTIPASAQQASSPARHVSAGRAESKQATRAAQDPWWKHSVIYEIYPRSFQDSNGDGVGDLKGITSRLDYLHDLGIAAIWITPMYPSPLVDFGYDVADYTALDPLYGNLTDFDHLVAEAKKRNIRVIMDFVPNHTSDEHPWFKESRSSRTNPKRDWYIWRDGKGPGQPPNDWQSWFGHSAWQFDPSTGQYYYHHFYVQQPDLNWRNPDVRKAMYGAMRFWLDRGVAGFRLDAVSRLFEDPNLRDDPMLPGKNAYGDPNIQHKYTDNLPEIHDVLREDRKSTRLNSSHGYISYAVFCLKKKKHLHTTALIVHTAPGEVRVTGDHRNSLTPQRAPHTGYLLQRPSPAHTEDADPPHTMP